MNQDMRKMLSDWKAMQGAATAAELRLAAINKCECSEGERKQHL